MKPVRMTLRQLEYFLATVDLGTFSAAAEHFHVSQTAISLATSDMERALGVQLFLRRRAKGPSLTAAGRSLVASARRVLAEAREFETDAAHTGESVSGQLVVGSFPTITPYVLGRALTTLPQLYPNLEIELVEDSVEGLQQRLREGTCEVALMYDVGIGDGITSTTLYSCRPYGVLPGHHRLADRDSITIAEVIDEPMIMIDLPPSSKYFLDVLTLCGYAPTIRYRTRSLETLRSLVGQGLGWSMLLHRPIPEITYDGARVVAVTLDDVPADHKCDVLLVRSADARITPRVAAFMHFCLEQVPSLTHRAAGYDLHPPQR